MTYWVGAQAAVEAAQTEAFAAYIASNPTATRDGAEIANPTTAWAVPQETAETGVWAIPAYPGMDVPDGCSEVETVEWPEVIE